MGTVSSAPRRLFAAVLACASLALAEPSLAQSGRARVRQLQQEANAAYNELDLDRAETLLTQALEVATRDGVSGSELARIHMQLGVVYVAGYADQGRGLESFMRALRADPTIEPDPMMSTPEVTSTFQLARARIGASGGAGAAAAPARPTLRHVPPVEQLDHTPLPLYVEVSSGASVARVVIMYKPHGQRRYRQAQLERIGEGFGIELPCADVVEGPLRYYVIAYDAEGRVVAGSGTDEQPHEVPVATRLRGPMPSLPGRAAPTRCSTEDCPPNGCASGASTARTTSAAGTGTSGSTSTAAANAAPAEGGRCILDSECGSGERCDDGACVDGPARPRFFLQLGGVVGAHRAGRGMQADASLPPGVDPTADPRYASYVPTGTGGCDSPTGTYCVRVTQAGVLPVVGGRIMLGYWVGPRFAIAVGGRAGPGGGKSALSFAMLSFRVHALLSNPDDTRFQASLIAGTGLGQVQVRPQQEGPSGTTVERPYAQVGLGSLGLGVHVGYRFADHFGLYSQLEGLLFYRNFGVGGDVALGAELYF